MGQLAHEAIAGLGDATAPRENLNDSIWIAGDLLARFHTNGGFKSGFSHIDAEIVTSAEATNLKLALLSALSQSTNPAIKGSILWALRHTRDADLMPLYIAHLEDAVRLIEGSSIVITSGLDCLNFLGEDVFEWENGSSSQAENEIEKNVRQARKYLQQLHPTMPVPFPSDRNRKDN